MTRVSHWANDPSQDRSWVSTHRAATCQASEAGIGDGAGAVEASECEPCWHYPPLITFQKKLNHWPDQPPLAIHHYPVSGSFWNFHKNQKLMTRMPWWLITTFAKEKAGAEQRMWPCPCWRSWWQLVPLVACQKSVSGESRVVSWLHGMESKKYWLAWNLKSTDWHGIWKYCLAWNLKMSVAVTDKLQIRCSFGGGEWRDGAESCQNISWSFDILMMVQTSNVLPSTSR